MQASENGRSISGTFENVQRLSRAIKRWEEVRHQISTGFEAECTISDNFEDMQRKPSRGALGRWTT
jgi:hypothetical protein